ALRRGLPHTRIQRASRRTLGAGEFRAKLQYEFLIPLIPTSKGASIGRRTGAHDLAETFPHDRGRSEPAAGSDALDVERGRLEQPLRAPDARAAQPPHRRRADLLAEATA